MVCWRAVSGVGIGIGIDGNELGFEHDKLEVHRTADVGGLPGEPERYRHLH